MLFSYLADKCRRDGIEFLLDFRKVTVTAIVLSSSRHRLLNLPDTRRTTHRWHRVGRSAGPTLIGQAEQKDTLYKHENQGLSTKTQVISDTYLVFQ